MALQRIAALSLRIVRQFVRDRRTMALLFLAPLVVMTLLQIVLQSSSSGATLAVVPPAGPLGQTLIGNLNAAVAGHGVTIITIAADQVDATLRNGTADGALIFPPDFAASLASGGTATVGLRLEGTDPSVASALRNTISLVVANLTAPTATSPNFSTRVSVATTYLYGGPNFTQTDALAPLFIGLFGFFFVFLLASVSFLRERSQGTYERLAVSPMGRTEVVLGYLGGFTVFALLQSLVILLYVVFVLQVHYHGNLGLIFLVTAALTVGGVNLGICASAFARNELQVIQFIPLLLVPQILLGGLFFPVKSLPVGLKQLAYVMPLTHANFALRDVMLKGWGFGDIWPELVFLVGFAALMVLLAALSLRGERT